MKQIVSINSIAWSFKQPHQVDDLWMVQLLSMDMCFHTLKLMDHIFYVSLFLSCAWLECVRSSKADTSATVELSLITFSPQWN
jgi:hypothetical protein